MVNKIFAIIIISAVSFINVVKYNGDSLAPVVVSGALIKHSGVEIKVKYPRKNCPVCKGNGWYLSGDKIRRVDCDYCEPEKGSGEEFPEGAIMHDPIIIHSDKHSCDKDGNCTKPGLTIKKKP
jgi:hypothetical protein